MKRKYLFVTLMLLLSAGSFAQTNKFIGTWEGKLNVGVELRVIFHITADDKGNLKSTADSPDQGAYGIKCDTTFLSGQSIQIEMKSLRASFSGNLSDDSSINGNFVQGASIPLTLKRTNTPSERKRPQIPQPPFPYKSEDVVYTNADKSLSYGATITIPEGKGPFPAAVMITGSGPQDRDENILGHKSFAVIADYLTRKGFIILRVDDRGIGKSTGKFSEATSADFAKDVSASVDYLLSRTETDKKKVGLIGHSEGGMIAPMVAAQRKDIDFIVLLAGPGVKIIDLMAEQGAAVVHSSGVSEKAADAYKSLYKQVAETIIASPDTITAIHSVKTKIENWAAKTNDALLQELGLNNADARDHTAVSLVRDMSGKWFSYFLRFDPQVYLEQLHCKVLALNGDKDIQVIAKQNLPGITAALKKSKATAVEIKEMPGLNHLFQACKKCTVQEYGELEETFSPAALAIMSEWLVKNTK